MPFRRSYWSTTSLIMKTVGSYEAKTHLPELLEKVRAGERYTITRHGVPVALLIPAVEKTDPRTVVDRIRASRKGNRLDGLAVRELIEEGRRR